LKAFNGDDASKQPGELQEVMLHGTAVSWIRVRERRTRPATPWTETPEEHATRLRAICQAINEKCDVEGLCRKFPERVQGVVDAKGDRIGS